MSNDSVSVVIPAKNEGRGIGAVLATLQKLLPEAEIVVVDDGSSDDTGAVARQAGARVIRHPHSKGNGAAVKAGVRAAGGDVLVLMDADGQHPPEAVPELLETFREGYDMVVGAREADSQASRFRWLANGLYNRLAGWMVGSRIPDLTSGFRVVRRERMKAYLYLLPNGFSYPTTITMAFFRAGYSVAYRVVKMPARHGKSHIRPLQDGVRFLLIIAKVGTLYSPLKLFAPLSASFFTLGVGYYTYTYFTHGRFTNLGLLLFMTALLVFLIGLVSEQITTLIYKDED